jgi:hypothetical protein
MHPVHALLNTSSRQVIHNDLLQFEAQRNLLVLYWYLRCAAVKKRILVGGQKERDYQKVLDLARMETCNFREMGLTGVMWLRIETSDVSL